MGEDLGFDFAVDRVFQRMDLADRRGDPGALRIVFHDEGAADHSPKVRFSPKSGLLQRSIEPPLLTQSGQRERPCLDKALTMQ